MKNFVFTCAALLTAIPASAEAVTLKTDLFPAHAIYHAAENKAGVAMLLKITPGRGHEANLMQLCEELRVAVGLGNESEDDLHLTTLFVVPYKSMAVEGYYLPDDGSFERTVLIAGNDIARTTLDRIVARAGIPPDVLDETDVEQEVSCSLGEPLWRMAWYDVRYIGDEEPQAVIERAHNRFLAIHRSMIEHAARTRDLQEAQRATSER